MTEMKVFFSSFSKDLRGRFSHWKIGFAGPAFGFTRVFRESGYFSELQKGEETVLMSKILQNDLHYRVSQKCDTPLGQKSSKFAGPKKVEQKIKDIFAEFF